MLRVKYVVFADLTDEEKEEQPSNGNGKEDAAYLKVTFKGNTIDIHSDAMEPEDCTFHRDLGWIKKAIEGAYDLGRAE